MTRDDYLAWSVCLLALLAIHGCALAPDSLRPEIAHQSHVTQHEPFTDTPTRYGVDTASLFLHWDLPRHVYLEIGDGLALQHHDALSSSYGELIGPREEFQARAGLIITVPK